MDFQLNLTLTDAFVSNGNRKLYLFRMGFGEEWKVSGLAWWENVSYCVKFAYITFYQYQQSVNSQTFEI